MVMAISLSLHIMAIWNVPVPWDAHGKVPNVPNDQMAIESFPVKNS
jgi:hypothetical protein